MGIEKYAILKPDSDGTIHAWKDLLTYIRIIIYIFD